MEYPITLMTDVLGNTIKFIYDEINNHYYIKEIQYGSSKTIVNDFASIKFFYKTRSDASSIWEAGIEIAEDRLLDYIQCINNSTTTRTYNFTYTLNRVSLLTQIDCILTSGSLNPLTFYYGTNNPQTAFAGTSIQLTSWYSNTTNDLVVRKSKFNQLSDHDGLITYPYLNPYYEFGSPKKYENEYASATNIKAFVYPELGSSPATPVQFTLENDFIQLLSGDVDGKSRDELIKINNKVSGTNDELIFTLYKPNSSGGFDSYKTTNYTPMTVLNVGGNISLTPKVFVLGDFSGNGKLQVLAVTRYNPLGLGNATKIMVFDIDAGTTLCNTTVSGLSFNDSNSSNLLKSTDLIFAMDYDGDGRSEICHVSSEGTTIYAFTGTTSLSLGKVATISDLKASSPLSRKLMVGDINGDGKNDLLLSPPRSYYLNNRFYDNGDEWTIYYSKGKGDANNNNGFDKIVQALFQNLTNLYGFQSSFILHDVNNDGRTDLVRMYLGFITVYPALGNGISTTAENAETPPDYLFANLIPTNVCEGNHHTQILAFYNVANGGIVDKISFLRDDTRERMLSGAINSLGVIRKTEYKKIDDKSAPLIYETGNTATAIFPYDDFNHHLWATAETQTWYSNVRKACHSYYYTKGKIHRQGLGFVGFESFSDTDVRNRVVTQTFEPMNYGVLKKVESPVLKVENTYNISTASNKIATVQLTRQKQTDLLKNNVITTDYGSFDTYNQPKIVETEYGAGTGVKTKQEYIFSNTDSGSGSARVYVLGLPTEEKITSTRDGSSWIDKIAITYNSSLLPDTKTTFTGATGTSQTGYETFEYDSEGNLTNHTVKPYSSTKTLTTSYTYDAKKRWVETETNPMNLTTTYGYDGFGRMTSAKNYLNQTTTFEYDVLDRQTKTISPDGVTNQTAFAWNTTTNGSIISVTSTATKRPTSIQYTNAFGQATRESEMSFGGTYSHVDYVYDEYGRLLSKSEPYASTIRFIGYEYDTYDRVTKTTSPSNKIITTTYSGNTVTTVDAGMSTSKTFDASGTFIQASDPAGNIIYTLRPDGQPLSIKTPDNTVTAFEYDAFGRQTKLIDPSAGAIQYEYNAEGLLFKQINARNQTIEYNQYTDWGQPKKIITPEQTIDYTYDATYKRVTKITSGTHYEVSYAYDALGRVKSETEKEGTITLVKDYTYDAGRLATVKYNNIAADLLTYTYNANGYLSSMKFGTTVFYTVNERNHFGQLKNTLLVTMWSPLAPITITAPHKQLKRKKQELRPFL